MSRSKNSRKGRKRGQRRWKDRGRDPNCDCWGCTPARVKRTTIKERTRKKHEAIGIE